MDLYGTAFSTLWSSDVGKDMLESLAHWFSGESMFGCMLSVRKIQMSYMPKGDEDTVEAMEGTANYFDALQNAGKKRCTAKQTDNDSPHVVLCLHCRFQLDHRSGSKI